MTTTTMNYETRVNDMNAIINCENSNNKNQLVKLIMSKYGLYIKNWQRMLPETIQNRAAELLWNDYYGQEKIDAASVIQRRFRRRQRQQKRLSSKIYNELYDETPLEIKWKYVRKLKKWIGNDKAFKEQRLTTMWNYGFHIIGVKNMTNEQMFDMCVRALFISHTERNRPKLKGIKWINRW